MCWVAAAGAEEKVGAVASIRRAISFEAIQQSPSVYTTKRWSSSSLKCSSACLWEDCCPSHGTCNYTSSKTPTVAISIPQKWAGGWRGSVIFQTPAWMRVCEQSQDEPQLTKLCISCLWMVLGKQILTLPRGWKGFLTLFYYCTVDVSFDSCPHWMSYLC